VSTEANNYYFIFFFLNALEVKIISFSKKKYFELTINELLLAQK